MIATFILLVFLTPELVMSIILRSLHFLRVLESFLFSQALLGAFAL